MKYVIIFFLIVIVGSLFSALRYMMTDNKDSTRMVKALTIRIGLSIFLFVLLMISFKMGWIVPNQVKF